MSHNWEVKFPDQAQNITLRCVWPLKMMTPSYLAKACDQTLAETAVESFTDACLHWHLRRNRPHAARFHAQPGTALLPRKRLGSSWPLWNYKRSWYKAQQTNAKSPMNINEMRLRVPKHTKRQKTSLQNGIDKTETHLNVSWQGLNICLKEMFTVYTCVYWHVRTANLVDFISHWTLFWLHCVHVILPLLSRSGGTGLPNLK